MSLSKCVMVSALSVSALIGSDSFSCSTFQLEHSNDAIMAKSYDYDVNTGYAFINTRGRMKTAIFSDIKHLLRAKKWVAKYGSVSFTQSNQEIAFSGMNEMGLATEFMDLDETIYPPYDRHQKYISEGQVGQYLLDNAATVEEALEVLKGVQVGKIGTYLHSFICDANQHCATIEFIDGKMEVATGASMTYKALTNSTYRYSVAHKDEANVAGLRNYEGTTMNDRSLARFKLVADASANYDGVMDPIAYAFQTLDLVRMYNPSTEFNKRLEKTQWNVVYNQTSKTIYFKTRVSPTVKQINFDELDFTCSKDVQFFNMNNEVSGNISDLFKKIRFHDRKELIKQFSAANGFQKFLVPFTSSIVKCEK